MELEISEDSENKTVGRREIRFLVMDYSSTPTRDAVKVELCKKLNLSPDSTVIVKMDQAFGTKRGSGIAHTYATPDAMRHYEQEHLFERGVRAKKKKEKAAAEAKSGEKKEEKAEPKGEQKTE